MAATGYTPISLYYSTTASAVPTAGNLANGELALNIADMKLYAKNSAGTVTLLASNASTTGVDSLSFGSTGLTPSTATTGAITVAGTLATTNGGTGLTSFTSGGVVYASGTSTLNTAAGLQFNGSALSVSASGGATAFNLTDSSSNVGMNITPASGAHFYLSNSRVGSSIFIRTSNASANDVTAMTFLSSGNVGIGTSSPSTKLTVRGVTFTDNGATGGASGLVYAMSASSGVNFGQIGNTGTRWSLGYGSSLTALGTEVLVWNDSGNVGIGTNSPTTKLQVYGTAASTAISIDGTGRYKYFETYASGTRRFYTGWDETSLVANLFTDAAYPIIFGTAGLERFRIGSGGQFGIGGANYGTTGQVLTSQGSGSAPTWAAAGGGSQAFVAFGSTGGL